MNSSSSPIAARRMVVRGRVQGVFFRASAAEHALALSLRGYARNQRDGSVLVCAMGDPDELERFVAWLHHGPPMAVVEEVTVETIDPATVAWPEGFLGR